MPRLRFTERAENDILEIGEFIAKNSPPNTLRFVVRLEARCRRLATRPYLGRPRDELSAGLRSIAFGRYVIFYRATMDGAEIVRVIHAARDI